MKNIIKKIWDAIVRFFNDIPTEVLWYVIVGLIVSGFFTISLGMVACIVPAAFVAFIEAFIEVWVKDKVNWANAVAIVSGGLVMQVFAILGKVWGF